jgi:PAS domain S-box-containing protein
MASPGPVADGVGGTTGYVCCRIEPAPCMTGSAARTASGRKNITAASGTSLRSLPACIDVDRVVRQQIEADQTVLAQRLRDHQFYTRSLFESNIDALMTTDASGIITDVNKQMEALAGSTRDELIGAPFKTFFTDPDRADAGIKLALSKRKVTDYELTVKDRDGKGDRRVV